MLNVKIIIDQFKYKAMLFVLYIFFYYILYIIKDKKLFVFTTLMSIIVKEYNKKK